MRPVPDGPLRVRPRLHEDVPALVDVLMAVHEADGYPAMMPPDPAAWLTGERLRASWVATLGGVVVGQVSRAVVTGDRAADAWLAATGCAREEVAVVKRLFVSPAATHRGVGRRLLETVVSDAHREGLWPVLDVDERSDRAKALYESAGFERIGTVELPWSGDGVFRAACYVGPPPAGLGRRPAP